MVNIEDIFKNYNIQLNEKQRQQFNLYYDLLIKYNNVMNLTAITEYNDVVIKHFLDSVLPYYIYKKDAKIIDIGTGAGFPSIPLKILRPDLCFTLVDSLNKRITFLDAVVKGLDLGNVELLHYRSEELAHEFKYRERYDYCVSRAVAKLNTLLELCVPFVKVDGCVVAYKGSNAIEEINACGNALSKLHCKIDKILDFDLPNEIGKRNIVIINKHKSTDKLYPRKNNLLKNKPL